jgi:hypothetical protein
LDECGVLAAALLRFRLNPKEEGPLVSDACYELAEVAALPWPHRPFKCGLKDDFSQFAPGWKGWDREDVQQAFRRFIESREPSDFDRCEYHQVDWPRLAEDAISFLLNAGGEQPSGLDIDDALEAEGRGEDAYHVWSFFGYDAIAVWPGGDVIENGQHRVCAMKQLGARRCVVARPGI